MIRPDARVEKRLSLSQAVDFRKSIDGLATLVELDIKVAVFGPVPMQVRVIKHVRKVYGCRDCEADPVTADKPAQLIEKSMASPSVLENTACTKVHRQNLAGFPMMTGLEMD